MAVVNLIILDLSLYREVFIDGINILIVDNFVI